MKSNFHNTIKEWVSRIYDEATKAGNKDSIILDDITLADLVVLNAILKENDVYHYVNSEAQLVIHISKSPFWRGIVALPTIH